MWVLIFTIWQSGATPEVAAIEHFDNGSDCTTIAENLADFVTPNVSISCELIK